MKQVMDNPNSSADEKKRAADEWDKTMEYLVEFGGESLRTLVIGKLEHLTGFHLVHHSLR